MKHVLLGILLTATLSTNAATISSYANLPGGGMGAFKFGKLVSAEIYFQVQGLLVMRGKASTGEETICIISSELAKKFGSDLASILNLIKSSSDAEVNCQNKKRDDGSIETDSFSISSVIPK